MPPKSHLLKMSRFDFGRQIIMPPKSHLLILLEKRDATKITSTYFTWKTSRCDFFGGQKKWRESFQMHEIGRIDGGRGFQTGGNVFQREQILRSEK